MGEQQGHEFRGNQYSGGGGAGKEDKEKFQQAHKEATSSAAHTGLEHVGAAREAVSLTKEAAAEKAAKLVSASIGSKSNSGDSRMQFKEKSNADLVHQAVVEKLMGKGYYPVQERDRYEKTNGAGVSVSRDQSPRKDGGAPHETVRLWGRTFGDRRR